MCVADGDPPRFYCKSLVRARKHHECEECGHRIAPGEEYFCTTAQWERGERPDRYVHCFWCANLGNAVQEAECSWALGSLLDDAQTTLTSYEHLDAPGEALGRVAGLLFRIRERKREAVRCAA